MNSKQFRLKRNHQPVKEIRKMNESYDLFDVETYEKNPLTEIRHRAIQSILI